MKSLLTAVVLLLAAQAKAEPYFRGPWSWAQKTAAPSFSAGACVDPIHHGPSTQCGTIGVITHSPSDGFVMVPGEDWSILSVGYELTGVSKVGPLIGQSYNVLPILEWIGSAAGFPVTIPSVQGSGFSITGSVSPLYRVPLQKSDRGAFLLQFGGTLRFGGK